MENEGGEVRQGRMSNRASDPCELKLDSTGEFCSSENTGLLSAQKGRVGELGGHTPPLWIFV